MSTVKTSYGTNSQAITCTITSMTNTAARQSASVDNSSNVFLDVLVSCKIKSGGSNTSASGVANVYAYGSVDGGTTYSDGAAGTDGAITLTVPPNMRLIGIVNMVANAAVYNGGPFSVANAFGGQMPDHWGIVIENQSGGTFDTTTGSSWYQGIYNQIV